MINKNCLPKNTHTNYTNTQHIEDWWAVWVCVIPSFRFDGICFSAQQAHYLHSVQMFPKRLVMKNIKGRRSDLLSSTNERNHFLFLNVVTKYVEPNKQLLITNSSVNTAQKRQLGFFFSETQRKWDFLLIPLCIVFGYRTLTIRAWNSEKKLKWIIVTYPEVTST